MSVRIRVWIGHRITDLAELAWSLGADSLAASLIRGARAIAPEVDGMKKRRPG